MPVNRWVLERRTDTQKERNGHADYHTERRTEPEYQIGRWFESTTEEDGVWRAEAMIRAYLRSSIYGAPCVFNSVETSVFIRPVRHAKSLVNCRDVTVRANPVRYPEDPFRANGTHAVIFLVWRTISQHKGSLVEKHIVLKQTKQFRELNKNLYLIFVICTVYNYINRPVDICMMEIDVHSVLFMLFDREAKYHCDFVCIYKLTLVHSIYIKCCYR